MLNIREVMFLKLTLARLPTYSLKQLLILFIVLKASSFFQVIFFFRCDLIFSVRKKLQKLKKLTGSAIKYITSITSASGKHSQRFTFFLPHIF